jgi:ferredoxin
MPLMRLPEVSMARLKITVNKNRCIGSEDCVETAPAVFQLDDDGKSEPVNPAGAPEAAIVSAARACPVKAITVVNDESGEQLFPPPKK